MEEKQRDPKREKEDMIRCANFIIQMVEVYGAEILEELKADKDEKKS